MPFLLVLLVLFPSLSVAGMTDAVTMPAGSCGEWDIWCNAKRWGADLLLDLIEIFQDLFYWIIDSLMGLAVYILGLLPSLDFLAFNWSSLAPWYWFIDAMGLDLALGIYGAALVFRLTRKVFTLGQW